MNASRARLYQTTLEQFYTRNPWGSVDQPVNPLSVPPPRHNGARGGLFALGAGQASAPIDVDEWTERRSASGVVGRASAPIDVDEWFAASLQTVNEGSGGSIGPPGAICAAASPNVRNIEEIREFFSRVLNVLPIMSLPCGGRADARPLVRDVLGGSSIGNYGPDTGVFQQQYIVVDHSATVAEPILCAEAMKTKQVVPIQFVQSYTVQNHDLTGARHKVAETGLGALFTWQPLLRAQCGKADEQSASLHAHHIDFGEGTP
ncbi:hypothetical protein B0H12DRAFT_1075220 [Mycena haematopus]|nr:hypothetical protein B0H12DRAFT_1075220 [Mycena haematopus]